MASESDKDPLFVVMGAGVVGQATASLLESVGQPAVLVDVDPAVVKALLGAGLRADIRPPLGNDRIIAFVCVPTPAMAGDTHDLAAVRSALGSLVGLEGLRHLTIVLRSTVTPGVCETLEAELVPMAAAAGIEAELAFMPEFLRHLHAVADALDPRAIVLASRSPAALQRLEALLAPFSDRLVLLDDPATAEMIKIAHNAFNAAKISFWNEMFRIGERHALDMDAVARVVAVTAEASWNPAYGIRGGSPFGGACLPKDLSAFIAHAQAHGIDPMMLAATEAINLTEQASADSAT